MSDVIEGRRPIRARETGWAGVVAGWLTRVGVRPNTISVWSVVFSLVCGAFLLIVPRVSSGWGTVCLLGSALCIQLRLLCNLFDGMVAIEGGFKTRSGDIFNDLPDRIADPVILVCAGYSVSGLPSAVALGWLGGILAVGTAYVRLLGASAGASHGFLGPMAKQHRMAMVTGACLLGALGLHYAWYGTLMVATLGCICVGAVVTIVRRTRRIIRELEGL